MVGYRADRHGDEAVALARVLSSAKSVEDVVIVQAVDEGSEDAERRDETVERDLARMAQEWPAHVNGSVRAAGGSSSAEALRAIATDQGADVIVLGSTHRGFIGRFLLRTTADRVADEASCAVAIAPAGFQAAASLRRIGIAYDGSEGARSALAWADDLAAQTGAELRLIGVVEPPTAPVETWGASVPGEVWADGLSLAENFELTTTIRERIHGELDAARKTVRNGKVKTVTPVGDAVQELRTAAEDLDLLVVGSHGHGGLASAIGSRSRALAHSCPSPLVLVPAAHQQEG